MRSAEGRGDPIHEGRSWLTCSKTPRFAISSKNLRSARATPAVTAADPRSWARPPPASSEIAAAMVGLRFRSAAKRLLLRRRKQSERGAQDAAAALAGAVGEGERRLDWSRGAWYVEQDSGEVWAPRGPRLNIPPSCSSSRSDGDESTTLVPGVAVLHMPTAWRKREPQDGRSCFYLRVIIKINNYP